jgi:hypothetical protein
MSHTSPAPTVQVFGSAPPRHGLHSLHHNTHSQSTTSNPRPMAIPHAREAPPPPLPPPRRIGSIDTGQDLGWRYGNSIEHDLRTVKPGSSLLGGGQPEQEYHEHYDRRGSRRGSTMSSMSTPIDPEMQGPDGLEPSDEDRNSLTRPNFRYVVATRVFLFLRFGTIGSFGMCEVV